MTEPSAITVAKERDALRADRQKTKLAAITERLIVLETRVTVFVHHGA